MVAKQNFDPVDYAGPKMIRRVVRAREHAGFSQDELSRKLHRSRLTIEQIEQGKLRIGPKLYAAIMVACEIPPNWDWKD